MDEDSEVSDSTNLSIYITRDIDKLEEEDRVAVLEIIEGLDYSKMLFYDSYMPIITYVARNGYINLLEILMKKYYEKNPDLLIKPRKCGNENKKHSYIRELLHIAICLKDYDLAELVLKYVYDINELDNVRRETALEEAIYRKTDPDIIELLLSN